MIFLPPKLNDFKLIKRLRIILNRIGAYYKEKSLISLRNQFNDSATNIFYLSN